MSERKAVNKETIHALLRFAGIEVPSQRAEQLAAESDALFSDAKDVSDFIAPRRDVGMAVHFSHLIGGQEPV